MMALVIFFLSSMLTIVSSIAISMIKKDTATMIEWNVSMATSYRLKFTMLMDMQSMLFSSTVILITTSVIIYTKFYIQNKKIMFTKTVLAFALSMLVLIISPNFISLMLGWEGLGMSSFILIMFYMNKKSIMSSLFTMMVNRIGDIALMLSMMAMMNLNSWSLSSISLSEYSMMMISISMFSKSAQIPFSAWLTEAMAAPTPVSALVHSSTLVTAGIYLMIRLETKFKQSHYSAMIFYISMTTLIMASINSLTQWDMKKIIALSTLSQLSIMFISMSMGMYKMAFFHMLVHAMFKSLIFLCSSTFISVTNTQDMRKMVGINSTNSMITSLSFNVGNLTLCGFPFTAGFYSKELIMEMVIVTKMSLILVTMFYLTIWITTAYSMNMMMVLSKPVYTKILTKKEDIDQKTSKFILLMPAVTMGNKLNWASNMNCQITSLTSTEKTLPLIFMMLTLIMISTYQAMAKKGKLSKLKMTMNYMWMSKSISLDLKLMLPSFFSLYKTTEKSILSKLTSSMKISMMHYTTINFKTMQSKFSTTILTMMIITMLTI